MVNLECKRCGYYYTLDTRIIPEHCPGCNGKINGPRNFINSNSGNLTALEYLFKIQKNSKAI